MAEADGEVTPPKHRHLTAPWKPGQSGNPAGRPRGARNHLSESFLEDLQEVWERRGKEVLEELADDKPEVLFNGVVKLMPRQINLTDQREQMNSEQRSVRLLAALRTLHESGALLPILERLGQPGSGDISDSGSREIRPPVVLPPV